MLCRWDFPCWSWQTTEARRVFCLDFTSCQCTWITWKQWKPKDMAVCPAFCRKSMLGYDVAAGWYSYLEKDHSQELSCFSVSSLALNALISPFICRKYIDDEAWFQLNFLCFCLMCDPGNIAQTLLFVKKAMMLNLLTINLCIYA